jgi:hypothetical protein
MKVQRSKHLKSKSRNAVASKGLYLSPCDYSGNVDWVGAMLQRLTKKIQ